MLVDRLFKRLFLSGPAAATDRTGLPETVNLSRRALAGAAGLMLPVAAGGPVLAAAAASGVAPSDPVLRDAALRGLALSDQRGDPVGAAAARAAIERLAETDPEAALLVRLYRALDERPSSFYRADAAPAAEGDLGLLHVAIDKRQPVGFSYTDLSERDSARTVLPLALVHPPQGVKLLAWCLAAEGYRQFFVRSMRDIAPEPGDFTAERLALLRGLVEKEEA